ncbi:hypothetical protein [Actinoallomurus sp. CA-142502]|uniref:hypothetical protein n=1 Tax=Actinoallomurus sp. CA-142502 TaxID=3239885 RepID=UPI003D9185D2
MKSIPPAVTVLLMEYEQLKEEQRGRISTRDNLVYATLGVISVTAIGAVETGRAAMLLLLPIACAALGWTHLVNDDRITAIGPHIQTVLTPSLVALLGARTPLLSWETRHRGDRWRRTRVRLQLPAKLILYCVPGAAALTICWIRIPMPAPLTTVAMAEALLVAGLAHQMTRHTKLANRSLTIL